jgi:hypothetical protein
MEAICGAPEVADSLLVGTEREEPEPVEPKDPPGCVAGVGRDGDQIDKFGRSVQKVAERTPWQRGCIPASAIREWVASSRSSTFRLPSRVRAAMIIRPSDANAKFLLEAFKCEGSCPFAPQISGAQWNDSFTAGGGVL